MNRILSFILTVAVLFCLCACNSQKYDVHSPVTYYYLRQKVDYDNHDSLIISHIAESAGHEGDYQYLISKYISGPSEPKLVSPFPAGTVLQELQLENNRVQIVLSSHMAEFNGVTMMVAFACLTKTIADMTGIQTVQIRIADNLINGEESITLSPNSFSYWDSFAVDTAIP